MMAKILTVILFVAALTSAYPAWSAKGAEAPAPKDQAAAAPAGAGSAYVVGPGDLLDISVWKDDALTKTVVVLPDGKISFPLIGEVTAGGKTVAQLKQEIENKLSRYVPDMVLSVEVKQCNSLLVYVIGRVNNPGRFVLNSNVNVLQGLALAGGLNPFAKKDDIKIFRTEGGKTTIFPFRYSEVADGNHLEDNIRLNQGDLILVP
jgi:polysaccharide export outer membrane protein